MNFKHFLVGTAFAGAATLCGVTGHNSYIENQRFENSAENMQIIDKYNPKRARQLMRIPHEQGRWDSLQVEADRIRDSLKCASDAQKSYFEAGKALKKLK